jgi:hypothetical protein
MGAVRNSKESGQEKALKHILALCLKERSGGHTVCAASRNNTQDAGRGRITQENQEKSTEKRRSTNTK